MIRWNFSPELCHTIVYDGDDHKFLDPSYGEEDRVDIRSKAWSDNSILLSGLIAYQRRRNVTYLELILLIAERGEKVVSDKTLAIQTDKHLYHRQPNGSWQEGELPTTTETPLTLAPVEIEREKEEGQVRTAQELYETVVFSSA